MSHHGDTDESIVSITHRYDKSALLVRNEYFGTENACNGQYDSLRKRLTYCYMLSSYALTLGSAPHTALLVHGDIRSAIENVERIDHAWLILPDYTVWEPISGNIMTMVLWRAYADARPTVVYSREETRACIIRYGHWGPWH